MKIIDKNYIAFTLIELLVVIAIIGILSGLIIVTMNGVTQKANIAKGQIFSNSLRNALMMNIVGEWKFDGTATDGTAASANDVLDTWGGVNNGTIPASPAIPTVKTGSNCVSGNCLSFDGTDDYFYIANLNSALDITGDITISEWIYPKNIGATQTPLMRGGSSVDYAQYAINLGSDSKVGIYFYGLTPYKSVSSLSMLNNNTWYLITATRIASSNTVKIYINGVIDNTATPTGSVASASSKINTIGAFKDSSTSQFFKGLIDDVRIFNVAMPTSQIKEQYFSGLNSLFINGGITKEEYLSRIDNYAIIK